ncbi:MAG: acyl-CoA thioesterase [Pirellulaceae bacterium]
MAAAYRTRRRVQFRDTDAAGIMHFSTYFTCMEEAEHELLRSLGTSVVVPLDPDHRELGELSWPRVAAECQYVGSARFEDVLEIEVQVARIGSSSVTYHFRLSVDDREIAHGSLTSVCCRLVAGSPPEAVPITDRLRQQLTEFQLP